MIDLISKLDAELKNGDNVEISCELYWYLLEVLPPKETGYNHFIFQEGDGDRIHIRVDGDRYYASYLSCKPMTTDWDYGFRLDRKDLSTPFFLSSYFSPNNKCCKRFKFHEGSNFKSVADLEETLNLNFR